MADEPTSLPVRTSLRPDEIDDPFLHAFLRRMLRSCDGDYEDGGPIYIFPSDVHPDLSFHPKKTRTPKVQEPGGNPAISTALPRQGTGFKAYKPVETEYGYPPTVDFVKNLGQAWAALYPDGPVLQIGDLAVQGGGPTPRSWGHPELGFHISHGSGRDFDVQIIAKGTVPQKPRSVTTDNEKLYDRERTQQLVDLIKLRAGKAFDLILSADTELVGITPDKHHTHHLHVRLKP